MKKQNSEYRCCIIGNNNIDSSIETSLMNNIENLILNHDVAEFIFSTNTILDKIALSILYELKNKYFNITIIYVSDSLLTQNVEFEYDKKIDLKSCNPVSKTERQYLRDRYMCDISKYLICYLEHSGGRTAKAYEYAKGKPIIIMNMYKKEIAEKKSFFDWIKNLTDNN